MARNRRIPGVLERAATGEGIMCPKCKTFAVKGRDGDFRCPNCGQTLHKEQLGKGKR